MKKLPVIIIVLIVAIFSFLFPVRKTEVWISEPLTDEDIANNNFNPGHYEEHDYNVYGLDLNQFKAWLSNLLPF